MLVDNFFHDQNIDNSHRNYCLNLVDPNQIAQKIQMLFAKSQYNEFIKEIDLSFPEVIIFFKQLLKSRLDIHLRILKYQLYDLIEKDINSAKQLYWSKIQHLIIPSGGVTQNNFEKLSNKMNRLLENPNYIKSRIFIKKLEESKQKFFKNLLREITCIHSHNLDLYTDNFFTNSHFDFYNRERINIELQETQKNDFDSDFEEEIFNNMLFHTSKDIKEVQLKEFDNTIPTIKKVNKIEFNESKMKYDDNTFCDNMDIDSISFKSEKFSEENLSSYSNSTKVQTNNCNSGAKFLIQKNVKSKEKIKKKIPFLKEFNPKFTKRENIDKKVLRKFKKYLKDYYKTKKNDFEKLENKDFWIIFLNGNLFPPMKFFQKDFNRTVEFKSFNTQYMAWVFSHKPSTILYNLFLKNKGEELYQSIIKKFKILSDSRENIETLSQLKNYVFNIADIFTSLNNSSNINSNVVNDNTSVLNNEEMSRRELMDTLLTENSIEMPAALPNSKGIVFDQLINEEERVYDVDQIFYNNDFK